MVVQRSLFLICLSMVSIGNIQASTLKTEIVEEVEKKEVRIFCSKQSEDAAHRECQKWLEDQKKTLAERVLTSFCGHAEISTGTNASSCLYRNVGEIKYILRQYRTETIQK